jgi:hypothetical protein
MIIAFYAREYDPQYVLCANCGRYVRINSDCECELLNRIHRKNSDIIKIPDPLKVSKTEERF